ncbi:MAG: UvrB/UvrC motif-containing protein [Tissierellales bacterium]
MNPKEKAKNLPAKPGVYLMKNSAGDIIYVGKSKCLKNRVSSYFQKTKNCPPKIERLVKTLKDFDYILTDTEFEAFMLECKLIKKLQPLYNRQMKNTSSYTYVEINTSIENMGLKTVHSPGEKHSTIYFGPYSSKNTVERAIQGIKDFCKINCNNQSKRSIPCLNYSLGLCIGMCLGEKAAQEYAIIINRIKDLLKGTDMNLLEQMKQKMIYASNNFDFETAAKYRDYVSAFETLVNKENVIEFTEDNKNIAVVEQFDDESFKLFLIKGKRVIFKEKYRTNEIDDIGLIANIRINILNYFKDNELSIAVEVKKEDVDQAQIIYSYLKSNNCNYFIIPEELLNSKNDKHIDEKVSELLNFEN